MVMAQQAFGRIKIKNNKLVKFFLLTLEETI